MTSAVGTRFLEKSTRISKGNGFLLTALVQQGMVSGLMVLAKALTNLPLACRQSVHVCDSLSLLNANVGALACV